MQQPTIQEQQELIAINDDAKTVIEIPRSKKKYRIGYIKPYAQERFTKFILEAEPEVPNSELSVLTDIKKRSRLHHKAASIIILNDWFKIKLFHGFFWRWLFFIKGYGADQLLPILIEGKKKIPVQDYSIGMAFLGMMMETTKLMTTKEAKAFQAELLSAYGQNSES